MHSVTPTLKGADFYQKSSPEEQAKIFATTAKAFNQGDFYGAEILNGIKHHKINCLDDINKKIDSFPSYMHSGRDAALSGAETFNTLRDASERNAMHESWQAVVANPLVNPTQLGADPKQPHLADQYATVKGTFVDPVQGRNFVNALEKGESHNYGDPSKSNSRGFYAEGKDFVQWDRNGQGRAFVGGEWSEFSRNAIALSHNKDHTLDVNITRSGQSHSLLHVAHPSGHTHAQSTAHKGHEAGALRQGMHNEQVQKLQTQLGELGYLDNTVTPDGKFGPTTAKAVEAFQADHHLTKGSVGPLTQGALQADLAPLKQDHSGLLPAVSAMSSLPKDTLGADDPRNALNPDHALYSKLQQRIPDASEQRLLQFTAACHEQGITNRNLTDVHFDRQNGMMNFGGSQNFVAKTASVDLKELSPPPAQSIQHIQQTDQQQVQIQANVQATIAQNNQQGPQGPTPGGPGHH